MSSRPDPDERALALRLLAGEKEETRRRDAFNAGRRRLPMVRIEKETGKSPRAVHST
jgi:predicted dithiol-disulfide oxidoreductase (DUF899 family)